MTKISIYLDDEVWAKFREQVFKKYGNLRRLSSEVENVLRSTLIDELVVHEFEKMGAKAPEMVWAQEVGEKRPTLKGPSSEALVREMREKRVEKALSGQ